MDRYDEGSSDDGDSNTDGGGIAMGSFSWSGVSEWVSEEHTYLYICACDSDTDSWYSLWIWYNKVAWNTNTHSTAIRETLQKVTTTRHEQKITMKRQQQLAKQAVEKRT